MGGGALIVAGPGGGKREESEPEGGLCLNVWKNPREQWALLGIKDEKGYSH